MQAYDIDKFFKKTPERWTIAACKDVAEKMARKLGHELGKWKAEKEWGRHETYCNLCGNYVFVEMGGSDSRSLRPFYGTAVDKRPVRPMSGGDIRDVRDRCWGQKLRGQERRRMTMAMKRASKIVRLGGYGKILKEKRFREVLKKLVA